MKIPDFKMMDQLYVPMAPQQDAINFITTVMSLTFLLYIDLY
tara:strand:- start:119 stop:244 length:126 start_codon:yes stop_codon:yes gene_type:complete